MRRLLAVGVQMFLTWVASRRNSWPSPGTGSNQSQALCAVQVRFRLPAESVSTAAAPSALPKYQSASTSSCSASTLRQGVAARR